MNTLSSSPSGASAPRASGRSPTALAIRPRSAPIKPLATARAVDVADGFLGRWSQRKQALREGREVAEPPAAQAAALAKPAAHGVAAGPSPQSNDIQPDRAAPNAPPAPAQVPTLADVQSLQADSSFAPF